MISRLVSFCSRVGRKPYDHPFIPGTEVPSMNRDIIQGHHYPDVGKLDVMWLPGLRAKSRIPKTRKTKRLPASKKSEPSKAEWVPSPPSPPTRQDVADVS